MEEKVTTNFIGSKRKNDWIVKIKSYISLQCWLHYIVKGYLSTHWSDYTTEKEKKSSTETADDSLVQKFLFNSSPFA